MLFSQVFSFMNTATPHSLFPKILMDSNKDKIPMIMTVVDSLGVHTKGQSHCKLESVFSHP